MAIFLLFLLLPSLSFAQSLCLPPRFPRTAEELVKNNPLYINSLPCQVDGIEDTSQIDNICITYFTLTDCFNLLLIYNAYVYINGTSEVFTYLVSSESPGFLQYSTPGRTFNNTIIGTDDTSDYVIHSAGDSGYLFTITRNYTFYPTQFQYMVNMFGYGNTDYLFLPMRLPSQCVTCITCSDNTRGCWTNNKQSRACLTNNCPTNKPINQPS